MSTFLGSPSALMLRDEMYLSQLNQIREEEEKKACEKVEAMDPTECTDSVTLSVTLASIAFDTFHERANRAFPQKPHDFLFYLCHSEPKIYALTNKIEDVIKKKLQDAKS